MVVISCRSHARPGKRKAIPMTQDDEFMFAAEVAAMTRLPESTHRYWATQVPEKGPPSFLLGRRRVWRRSGVLAWLAEQERATSTDRAD